MLLMFKAKAEIIKRKKEKAANLLREKEKGSTGRITPSSPQGNIIPPTPDINPENYISADDVHTDRYIVDEKGERVPDYKQAGYSTILNNKKMVEKLLVEGQIIIKVPDESNSNRISGQGCYITSIADVATFNGNSKTPPQVDAIADTGYYATGKSGLGNAKGLVENGLNGTYTRVPGNSDDLRSTIDTRLGENRPTIIEMVDQTDSSHTHFAVVSGARYDREGNITQYLLSDPGSRNPNITMVNRSDLSYVKNNNYQVQLLVLYDKK